MNKNWAEDFKMIKYKNNKGFSMVEIMLVITFIVVAVAGVFIAYSKANDSSNVQVASGQIAGLTANIRNYAKATNSFSNFTTPNIITDKVYPNSMVPDSTGSYLNGPWGPIVVNTSTTGTAMAGSNVASIVVSGVTGNTCIQMVQNNAGAYCYVDVVSACSGLTSGSCTYGSSTRVKNCTTGLVTNIGTVTSACNAANLSVAFGFIK